MISARKVNLVRVSTLPAAQRALALLSVAGSPAFARDRTVLVPTRSAAEELRRTIEHLLLVEGWAPLPSISERLAIPAPAADPSVAVLPAFATREEWYHDLAERLPDAQALLTLTERELLLGLAADAAAAEGTEPPFAVRAGLVAEMLSLYDAVGRRLRTIGDFERVLVERLEPAAEYDRGAARLLQQTRFLVAAYRGYESRLAAADLLDEHRLRARLVAGASRRPLTHLVLAVADRIAEPGGLWPADFDLVLTLPGLERVDVVATDRALSAGWYERLQVTLPGLDVCDLRDIDVPSPVLVAPDRDHGGLFFTSRDREDELSELARRIVSDSGSSSAPDETAVVYQRPLPYLYLARQVLDEAQLPWEATDALPLAGEPYAAAFALVLDAVASGFSREGVFALLASPLFGWGPERWTPGPRDLGWLERRLDSAGALGAADDVRTFAASLAVASDGESGRASRFATAIGELVDGLDPLAVPGPVTGHAARLAAFLDAHERPPSGGPELVARELRARAAVRAALDEVSRASGRFGDRTMAVEELALLLTRWIEARTFQPRVGHGAGVRLVDAVAARFGRFSRLHIVGLVEGEWPETVRQTVFYPASLLRDLGWPPERERQLAARAAFFDLMSVATAATSLSTFTLEQDALVRPSVFLEDLEPAGLAVVRGSEPPPVLTPLAALAHGVIVEGGLAERTREAALLRASRTDASDPRFHGSSGAYRRETHAVTAVETYLACPFKYFASRVLRLEEEGGDDVGLDPRERGRLVHEVFQAFFEAWGARGRRGITVPLLQEARELFEQTVEAHVTSLPAAERAAERLRLLGSAAAPGMGERVLRLEAERDLDLEARLLEFDLAGEYELPADAPRRVRLRGIADRIDLTADGRLHLFDYKTGRPPHRKRAIQLPIYSLCAERKLEGVGDRIWRVGEAAYLALSGPRPYAAAIASPDDREGVIAEGAARLAAAVDAIERGEFPPRPAELSLCPSCAWAAVCRKDYVDPPA